jgi:hypothetical protein
VQGFVIDNNLGIKWQLTLCHLVEMLIAKYKIDAATNLYTYFLYNMTPNFMDHFYVTVTPNSLSHVLSFNYASFLCIKINWKKNTSAI